MRRALLLLVLATTLSSGIARADAWDAAMARGAAAKEKALDGEDPLAWQEVLDLFLEADAIRSTKESKYEIAFAASKTKAIDLAVEAYEIALELGLSGPAEERAKAYVAERALTMARVKVVGPTGAFVFLNGRKRAVLPAARPIVVFPGAVHVRVVDATKTSERTVDVSIGETKTIDVTPAVEPPSKPVAPPPPVAPPAPPSKTLGWALVGTGVFIGVASSALWIVSAQTVATRRESLNSVCLVRREDDSDLCRYAENDQYREYAQEDSNLIRTFRPLRVVGAIGLGVGLLVAGLGVYRLQVTPDIAHDRASLTLRVAF